jgi:tetratricopeptide (TPR) repeat protein
MASTPSTAVTPRRRLPRALRWTLAALALAAVVVVAGLFSLRASDDREPVSAPAATGVPVRAGGDALSAVTGTAKTLEELQARVAARPDDPEARALLGIAYLQRARETSDPSFYTKADTLLAQARQLDPDEFNAILGQGSLALSRHDFRGALALGERALALSAGGSQSALAIIGDAQVELGRYPEAFATFDRLARQRPNLVAYARQSYALELQGALDPAIDLMRQAVQAGSGSPENTQWTRIQLGHLLERQGRIDEAEAEYRQALAIIPNYARAETGLGSIAVARGDLPTAEQWYRSAANHLPLPEIVIALGDVRAARGDAAGAGDAYALVRAMESLFAQAGGNNDLELALFDANHAQPGADVEAVVSRARSALAERPSVAAHDALGWALFKAGRCDQALPEARAATALGTVDPQVLYHLGAVADCAGDASAAREALTRALQANPRFHPLDAPAAQSILDRLGRP